MKREVHCNLWSVHTGWLALQRLEGLLFGTPAAKVRKLWRTCTCSF